MRFTKVALYSLSAASAFALPAQAASSIDGMPTQATTPRDLVIQTEAPADASTTAQVTPATIAQPETIALQPEFVQPTPQSIQATQATTQSTTQSIAIARPETIAAVPVTAGAQDSPAVEKYSPIDRYRSQVFAAKAARESSAATSTQPTSGPASGETSSEPLSQPVLQVAGKSIATQASQSQVSQSQPIVKPAATKPTAKPATKPVIQPKPTTKPTTKPATKPATKPEATLSETGSTLTTDVKILGVESELQAVARQVLLTQPGKSTNATIVRDDVAALLDTGLFTSASASALMNPKGVDIAFNLVPVIAQSVELVNAKSLTSATATQLLQPQLGKPVQPSLLNQGVRDLQQWYSDRGYNLARVVGMSSQQNGVLKVTVAEGEVGEVKIRFIDETGRSQDDQGNAIKGRTQESFIRQSIQLQKGTAFKETTAQADLDRLFKTGLFLGGRVTLEGDLRNATVVYNLVEQQLRRTDIGGGYSSDIGLNANVSYRDFNFGGLGQQLGGSVIVGAKDFQFDGRFANPYRDSQPETWGYSLQGFRNRGLSRVFDGDVKLASGNEVREGRFGGGINFSKPIAPDWSANVGLGYNRVSARDANGDLVQSDAAGNPLSLSGTGLDDLYSVSAGLSQDKRDNILDPKSGSLLSVTSEQYVPIGVGNVFANRISANYSQYVPINLFGRSDRKTQDILAFNVQGGTTIGDLPPSQAFLLGGVNSVRGFEQGKVGIGKSYAVASAEYRFPILNDTVGGTLFADYGTDLGSSGSVVGAPGIQRNRSGSGLGYGAGVRVNSPLGLLRADWGFNDRGENRIQFGVGQKF